MHRFSKNLRDTSKSMAPEGWHETTYTLRRQDTRHHHRKFIGSGYLSTQDLCPLYEYFIYKIKL